MFNVSTRKVGRIRLVRIGRLALAFGILGTRPASRRNPAWLSVDGVRLRLPEIVS